MYPLTTTANIHPDIRSAEQAICNLLDSTGKAYTMYSHIHRKTCRATFRDNSTNRLLATIDIMNWSAGELPDTAEFNTLREIAKKQEYVNIFYTCIW